MLIWRIFAKDVKLLWPLALAVLASELALLLLTGSAGPFPPPIKVGGLATVYLLTFLIALGSALLIVMAVQQDPIPGVGQDWLARPIRRRDLFLAKLLFVLLVIHAPLLVTGMLHGLWDGFSPGASLAAALVRNLGLLLLFSLPCLTIGALTRNLTEVLVGAVAMFIGFFVALLLLSLVVWWITHVPNVEVATLGSGIAWVWQTAALALLSGAMAVILTLLYARRRVLAARLVLCAPLLVAVSWAALPWGPAFALQAWLSGTPGTHPELSVAFEPAQPGTAPSDTQTVVFVGEIGVARLMLQLRYSGVPRDLLLRVDHSDIRMVDEDGRTVFSGTAQGDPGDRFIPLTPIGPMMAREFMIVPAEIYRQHRDRPLRLEIDQFMTLIRARKLPPLPATGGDQRVAGIGRCATRLDGTGSAIEVGCVAAGELPADCLSMMLVAPTGAHNPPWMLCQPDYAPWRTHLALDAISQSYAWLPFLDPTVRVRYPVDASQLREAHVVLTVYEPVDHLVRSVEVPEVRLRDLAFSNVQPAAPLPPGAGSGAN
jgi:hypothetical protein